MRLDSLTRLELIFPGVDAEGAEDLLRKLAEALAGSGTVESSETLFRKLWEREQLGSTGIGSGVAIPHCKVRGLDAVTLSIATVPAGVDFGAVDGKPVRVVFLLLSPPNSPTEHLQSLAEVSRWIKTNEHPEKLLSALTREEIYRLLQEAG